VFLLRRGENPIEGSNFSLEQSWPVLLERKIPRTPHQKNGG